MARSFPSCLLSFTNCFSLFILDVFFSQTSFVSFLVGLLLCDFLFFLHCCMSGIFFVCLFVYERAHEKVEDDEEEVALYGMKKNSLCGTWSWFICFINFLLLHHYSCSIIFLLSFTKDHCLYVYAPHHHQKLLVRAHSSYLWKNLDRSRQKLVGMIFFFHCSQSLLTSLPLPIEIAQIEFYIKGLTLYYVMYVMEGDISGNYYYYLYLREIWRHSALFSFCSFGGRKITSLCNDIFRL